MSMHQSNRSGRVFTIPSIATVVLTVSLGLLISARLLALDLDPRLVGSYDTTGYASGVALSGRFAYVADGDSGLQIIDVSNRANPRRVGGCDTSGEAWAVAVSGNYAYVADWHAGLQVIDVSDPANPRVVGSYDTTGHASDVAVSGNYAYVADGDAGLQVIDVSDPATPQRVGIWPITVAVSGSSAWTVAVSGRYAYVEWHASYDSGGGIPPTIDIYGLQVIDVSNPANPQGVGGYSAFGYGRIAVSGNYAYVADAGGIGLGESLQTIDISNPANPQSVGGSAFGFGWPSGIAVAGNYAFVAHQLLTGEFGLQVIDISNPVNPQPVSEYPLTGRASSLVTASGGFVYLTAGEAGLQVIDASRPANPQRVGGYYTGLAPGAVSVSGNYAYVADGDAGLQVIDVSDPANPQRVGGYDSGSAGEVAVSGNYAYVVDGQAGLQVIDVSDPANPQRIGAYGDGTTGESTADGVYAIILPPPPPSNPVTQIVRVAVSGNYAYVEWHASYDYAGRWVVSHGFDILDVSNPANPQRVGRYYTELCPVEMCGVGWSPSGIAVSGNYAFLAVEISSPINGLQVIDISNPASPQGMGSCVVSGVPYGIAVSGSYAVALVAQETGTSGLQVIDISNPANPQHVGTYVASGYIGAVAVSGNYAYVTHVPYGIDVIDLSDPANPLRVGGNNSFHGEAVTVANGKVFAAGAAGLIILHEYQPIRFDQISRQPNDSAMRLRIAGPPGVPGRVQRSADLRTWTDWLPVHFAETSLEILDSDAASQRAGFYRLAIP